MKSDVPVSGSTKDPMQPIPSGRQGSVFVHRSLQMYCNRLSEGYL